MKIISFGVRGDAKEQWPSCDRKKNVLKILTDGKDTLGGRKNGQKCVNEDCNRTERFL